MPVGFDRPPKKRGVVGMREVGRERLGATRAGSKTPSGVVLEGRGGCSGAATIQQGTPPRPGYNRMHQ